MSQLLMTIGHNFHSHINFIINIKSIKYSHDSYPITSNYLCEYFCVCTARCLPDIIDLHTHRTLTRPCTHIRGVCYQ